MAETKEVVVDWVKGAGYQLFQPTGITITNYDTADGVTIILRLTLDYVEVKGEKFQALVTPNGIEQVGAAEYIQRATKIDLANVKLNAVTAGQLTALLVERFGIYPLQQQNQIKAAIQKAVK